MAINPYKPGVMKYMDPSASGFKNPVNSFGTLQFFEEDRPPPFRRYFCPAAPIVGMLKEAKYFGRITIIQQLDEQQMFMLLNQGPLPISNRNVTYAGQMLLVYSSDEQEIDSMFENLKEYLEQHKLVIDPYKTFKGISRNQLENTGGTVLNVYDDKYVELCDEIPRF